MQPAKQHLINPEICIRCYTCESMCPAGAIEHDDVNVVVNAAKCNFCLDCIAPCPTGSIDEWRVVATPYSLAEQFAWRELPAQQDFDDAAGDDGANEALDREMARLLAEAHGGAGGRSHAPRSASKPTINLYTLGRPAEATVQGNYRLTASSAESDVRHIILDLGGQPFPVLEGQSVGVIPPGLDAAGKPHLPRLYSVSSPRDGERPNFNNLSLTVKREAEGVCSNYLCDLEKGARVRLAGPFGATFLMPNDAKARLLLICTGTGSAPFRAFTMRRQRNGADESAAMTLVFGARSPDELPYFGPLAKVPDRLLKKHLVFSRLENAPKRYVQDKLREEREAIGDLLVDPNAYIYVCGLRAMEKDVEEALAGISESHGRRWSALRETMREEGRYHVETY
ncbi:MAG: benzoyl-CoA 2,3-epoxidase subunit BoxA [Hyphomicrobiales bacterium]|nr:benzoyl-CoA 2,3-epoxidase subunit BoxA [Hyphomicrobiales bacterium]